MWESAVAFTCWGFAGAFLVSAKTPALATSALRYFFAGIVLNLVFAIAVKRRARSRIPWNEPALWAAGSLLLIENISFAYAVSRGPIALAAMIYALVPLAIPVLAVCFSRAEKKSRLSAVQWGALLLAFAGNLLITSRLGRADAGMIGPALAAFTGASAFALLPLLSSRLQAGGVVGWELMRSQTAVASLLAVPAVAILWATGLISFGDSPELAMRTSLVALAGSVLLTLIPFSLWFRGIRRDGAAKTAVFGFLEPMVSCLLSLFYFQDLSLNASTAGGIALLLAGVIGSSLRFEVEAKFEVRPVVQTALQPVIQPPTRAALTVIRGGAVEPALDSLPLESQAA